MNTLNKTAPIPWKMTDGGSVEAVTWKVRAANGRLVATVRSATRDDKEAEAEALAKARVLTQAPRLLDYCERLADWVEAEVKSGTRGYSGATEVLLSAARAVIAEAKESKP